MGVALITPFKEDESVDYEALARLVDYQLQNGTDYLVVLGTTAETPTLTEEEKKNIGITELVYADDKYNGTPTNLASRRMLKSAGVKVTPYQKSGRRIQLEV